MSTWNFYTHTLKNGAERRRSFGVCLLYSVLFPVSFRWSPTPSFFFIVLVALKPSQIIQASLNGPRPHRIGMDDLHVLCACEYRRKSFIVIAMVLLFPSLLPESALRTQSVEFLGPKAQSCSLPRISLINIHDSCRIYQTPASPI